MSIHELKPSYLPTGTGGGGNDLGTRVANLEKEMAILNTRLDTILPSLATKADVLATKTDIQEVRVEIHSMANRLIMWSVATILAGGGLVFAILRVAP